MPLSGSAQYRLWIQPARYLKGWRLGAARMEGFKRVTMKYRQTPQPQVDDTTPGLTSVSVALRNLLSVLAPELKERGTSTPHPVPRPRTSLTNGQFRGMLPPADTKGGVLFRRVDRDVHPFLFPEIEESECTLNRVTYS